MAGNKIKGITIEFNGDTTKLNRAISDTDKKIRNVDKSLNQVNRALRFNPGNTELLAQKQTLLKEKIDQTKVKLDALRQAQAKLDDDPAVDKTSHEYMELRRKIIETESKLEHFESELKKLDKIRFEQLGKQVQDVGNKMKDVGTNMTKYVTGPIVAGAGAAVAAFKEVDAGLDIVAEKTGATGKKLDAMQESAKNLATEIPTDFETAGSAIGEVNTRFGLTGQALEDLSGKFIKFADLNNTDVSSSIDAVQKAMAAYGIEAEDAGDYLDVLNKVGQDTGVNVDQLAQSVTSNASALKAMGMDSTQAAFFVGQLEKSGVDSSVALGGLQRALANGAKDGKSMEEVMAEVSGKIKGAGSDTEATAAAMEIFGTKAGPKLAEALRSGALDFDALSSSATDAVGSIDKTFEETLDPADKFTMALNRAKVTGYEVGATILDMAAPALEKLSGFLQTLQEKWQSLSPETQKFIVKAAGFVAAIGPILVVVGTLITKVGMLITYLPALGGAFSVLLGPVGLVIAAIAAAIAIGVALYKNWDKIKAAASKLKTFIVNKFNALKDGISKIFGSIRDKMVKPIEKARDLIRGIINKIKGFFSFKFKLPHIKLPHFAINPKGWHLGDLLEGVIPSLGIDWYAKGGIFTKPSVIGIGEGTSPEAVIPIDKLQTMISESNSQLVAAMITAMQAMNTGANGGEFKFVINLGGTQVATEIFKLNKQGKMIMEA